MAYRKSEMSVITQAKDLASYIMAITLNSPKRFRFTLVSKLQSYALCVIEYLYLANEVFVASKDKAKERLYLQRKALTYLKLIAYLAKFASEQNCILNKHYEQITKRVYDCQNLLGAWINSDKKRFF